MKKINSLLLSTEAIIRSEVDVSQHPSLFVVEFVNDSETQLWQLLWQCLSHVVGMFNKATTSFGLGGHAFVVNKFWSEGGGNMFVVINCRIHGVKKMCHFSIIHTNADQLVNSQVFFCLPGSFGME